MSATFTPQPSPRPHPWSATRKMRHWTVTVNVTRQDEKWVELVKVQARTRGEAERLAEDQLATMGYDVEAQFVHDEGEVE